MTRSSLLFVALVLGTGFVSSTTGRSSFSAAFAQEAAEPEQPATVGQEEEEQPSSGAETVQDDAQQDEENEAEQE
jgi:hypothetical protein